MVDLGLPWASLAPENSLPSFCGRARPAVGPPACRRGVLAPCSERISSTNSEKGPECWALNFRVFYTAGVPMLHGTDL